MIGGTFAGLILMLLGLVAAGLIIAFVLVPLLKGIGWIIEGIFKGIGGIIRHIYLFIAGMLTDSVRFVGALIAMVVLMPLLLLNIVIGRWSAAGHFGNSIKRECNVAANCIYRVGLQRPLRLVFLSGLLEGVEQRVNEAMLAAPTSDKPSKRTGVFDGYTIVGSLPGGGSGAKLYIAEPNEAKKSRNPQIPDRVVIKTFALADGSSLPQIVRESRALEAAKQLGLVLEHDMDEHRFYYIMPFHDGDHLGVVTRQLHGKTDGKGLKDRQFSEVLSYVENLLHTLSAYHRGGLWHKDIKPENIIIHDGVAHVVDLGLVTPLRSAMTLTTHGTEYFRDPEMVRMALKGVKVHQVDGAKFDIYAVGAVLYYVLENTFPAHGGLSAFQKRSPEAMRWVVRRAMADYNKRYENVDQMLADIHFIASASHPFAVKPAQLPSLRGEDLDAQEFMADAPEHEHVVAAAGSPRPPLDAEADEVSVQGWGVSIDKHGVKVGKFAQPAVPAEAASPAPPVPAAPAVAAMRRDRPKLSVFNWWTGAYKVKEDVAPAVAQNPETPTSFHDEIKAFREQATAFRADTQALRDQVRNRTMAPRKAAREQIKAARARAKEIRRRVSGHRYQARNKDRNATPVVGLVLLFVIVGGAAFALLAPAGNRGRTISIHATSSRLGWDLLSSQQLEAIPDASISIDGHVLLVVNDHPAKTNPVVKKRIGKIIAAHKLAGWEVLIDNEDAEVDVRQYLPAGEIKLNDELHALLRTTMLSHKLAGVIRITASSGDEALQDRIDWDTIPAFDFKKAVLEYEEHRN